MNDGSSIYNTVSRDGLNNFIVPFHGLPSTYAYNSMNRIIKQTSPDGGAPSSGTIALVNCRYRRMPEQLQPLTPGETGNRYSYTKYDALIALLKWVKK